MTDEEIVFKAMQFAIKKHGSQERKYTGEPYWSHLAQVAGLVSSIHRIGFVTAIAWLHDILEDTETTDKELQDEFGGYIWKGIKLLSDLEEGNRDIRKRLSRERLSEAPDYIQDIKVCDLISNTSSILKHDPKFAKVYLEEKRLLLDCLTKADPRLVEMAKEIIVDNLN